MKGNIIAMEDSGKPEVKNDVVAERNIHRFAKALSAGAEFIGPDLVRFRVWAPDAQRVQVILQDSDEYELEMEEDQAWFSVTLPCTEGTLYRYHFVNKQEADFYAPDPFSRLQASNVHGNSVVVQPTAYQWLNPDWRGRPWHESIIYEIHVGIYGGFKGVKNVLREIAALGFTAIELMPIAGFSGDRNWGYDGVLQFAPHHTYGTPDDLKSLVDEAHTLGMSIFLDVVYNHFGPEGNYLHQYASAFFTPEIHTPWGNAIDFTHAFVQTFYTENVIYWLEEFQFDGLRFDACHAIYDKSWLFEIGSIVRKAIHPERLIHLVAENDENNANLLQSGFQAQWNDDGHHVLHVLLTDETEGYYSDYADEPARKLARCLTEGFVYQGEVSPHRGNTVRGEASGQLSSTSFVLFLQNHDQVGNRPFGERLTTIVAEPALRVANALLLLSPQIPLVFMGEEFGATEPFLYFVSHEDPALVSAVREGRRKEFSTFGKFSNQDIADKIPDPFHVDTFLNSTPRPTIANLDNNSAPSWEQWTSKLLSLRHRYIIPRLDKAKGISASAIGPKAVKARWLMNDGTILAIALNFAPEPVSIQLSDVGDPNAQVLFDYNYSQTLLEKGQLPGYGFIALLEGPL